MPEVGAVLELCIVQAAGWGAGVQVAMEVSCAVCCDRPKARPEGQVLQFDLQAAFFPVVCPEKVLR